MIAAFPSLLTIFITGKLFYDEHIIKNHQTFLLPL